MSLAIPILMGASFALTAYSTYSAFEDAEKQAEMQKENIELQKQKLELQEQARKTKEDLEQAKLRREARKQRSNLAIKQAMSGTTSSSMYSGIEQSLETSLQSNLSTQSKLSDISADMYGLSQQGLDLQRSSIQSPSDLDLAIGIGSQAVSSGIGYYGYKQSTAQGVDMQPFSVGEQAYRPTPSGYSVPFNAVSSDPGFNSFTIK